jgi:hypothetical protein
MFNGGISFTRSMRRYSWSGGTSDHQRDVADDDIKVLIRASARSLSKAPPKIMDRSFVVVWPVAATKPAYKTCGPDSYWKSEAKS